MDPLSDTQVQGGTEEGEDNQIFAENSAPVDEYVPRTLENENRLQ